MLRFCQQFSFNSTNAERSLLLLVTQATDLSLRGIKCCSDVFGVTLRLLVINISSTSPVNNKQRHYYQRQCHNLSRFGGDVSTTPSRGRSVDSSQLSQILAQNRDFCLPLLHSTPPLGGGEVPIRSEYCHAVWYGKLEWLGYPTVKKNLTICLFVLIQVTNATDRHTHRQTPHGGIGLAYVQHRAAKNAFLCTRFT